MPGGRLGVGISAMDQATPIPTIPTALVDIISPKSYLSRKFLKQKIFKKCASGKCS
jgi:hypothetical protein